MSMSSDTSSADDVALPAASNPTDSSSSPSLQNEGQGGGGTTTEDSSPPDDSSTSTPQHHHHQQQQTSSKKRRSNIQLNKDDHPEGDDGNCSDEADRNFGDINDEGGNRSDPFQRASEDVLQKRKMARASLSPKWSATVDVKNNGGTPTKEDSGLSSSFSASKPTSAFGLGTHTPAFGSVTAGVGFGTVAAAANNGERSGFALGFGNAASGDDTSMSSKSSSFGGGFGSGFGTVSGGFGSLKSSSSSTFGLSFGSTSNKATATTSSDVLASSNDDGGITKIAKSPTKVSSSYDASPTPETSPNTKFPISEVVDTANGEQDEECLCQIRARLYKMVPEDESTNLAVEDQDVAVPSVPSTQRNLDLVTKVKGDKERDGSSKNEAKESKGEAEAEEAAPTKPKLVQKEAGLGPVRILKCKIHNKPNTADEQQTSARIVQRQETSGGGAFRVILNVRLEPKSCTFNRRGDKFVQLNALNNSGLIDSYLFKVKTTVDADTLENILKDVLQV